MSVAEHPVPEMRSPRALRWARRRGAAAEHWRTFRGTRQGMIGLAVLTFFVAVAIVGPFFVSAASIEPATATGPLTAPPSLAYPLGTDNFGRSVLSLMIVGAEDLAPGGIHRRDGHDGGRSEVGITSGYFGGGRIDTLLNGFTNWFLVLPWIALADRAHGGAGTDARERHRRHRGFIVLGEHRSRRP